MPRKAASELAVLPIKEPTRRLPAPSARAPEEVRKIFAEIVRAAPEEHFVIGDAPLIEQYAQSIALARRAYAELAEHGPVTEEGKQSPWLVAFEKANRASVALSARLRLAPQSRADSRSAGRKAGGLTPSVYDAILAEG
jgi:phage terminase small subunit